MLCSSLLCNLHSVLYDMLLDMIGCYDKNAIEYYNMAYRLAISNIPPHYPLRLQTALNYAVCLWEIMRERMKACELARNAFDGAIAKLDELNESAYHDASLILQLLRDNLTLWSSHDQHQHMY